MKITIVAPGKLKEAYFHEALKEYSKRLSKYCNLTVVEVADEKTADHAGAALLEQIKEKEAARIERHLKKEAALIALVIDGRPLDSLEFSKQIETLAVKGRGHLQFVIGGSVGLHHRIMEKADLCLSFSQMTFPHQLMRVILLEQIYRGFRILNQEPYHK